MVIDELEIAAAVMAKGTETLVAKPPEETGVAKVALGSS